jgi:hypothetical protein
MFKKCQILKIGLARDRHVHIWLRRKVQHEHEHACTRVHDYLREEVINNIQIRLVS